MRETRDGREVRFEDEWPLPNTEYRRMYLEAGSGSLAEMPAESTSVAEYQPLTETAVFTKTFDEDTELTGHMKLRLWVSTTEGTDIDLFVGVKKLDVHGQEVHFYAKAGYMNGPVAMGWLRVSERALDEDRSTPWQPVLSHDDPSR